MCDITPEPTHRPEPDAEIQPLMYQIGCGFFPPIKLDKKSGLEFAAELSDYVDTSRMKLESSQWQLSGGLGSADGLEILIGPNSVQLKVKDPPRKQEFYEERYQIILTRFQRHFEPQLFLGSAALIRGLLNIDGDSRAFIGSQIMKIDPSSLGVMGRPLHLLGARFFFPPYEELSPDEEEKVVASADWSVNVKIESWIEDPRQVFLEADAKWQTPVKWDDSAIQQVVGRLQTVEGFIKEKVHAYLMQSPENGGTQE